MSVVQKMDLTTGYDLSQIRLNFIEKATPSELCKRTKERKIYPSESLPLPLHYHHYMNLVHGPARHESFVVQWLEHPTGCSEGLRFNSCRGSEFFFVPCSGNVHHILSYSHYCCYRARP